MSLDPQLETAIRTRLAASEFRRWMGFDVVTLSPGASEIHMTLEPHHMNPGGIAHGGVVATLLDAAIGLALRTQLGFEANHVTIDLNVHYFFPARPGPVRCSGRAVHAGRRTSFGEADLFTGEGRLLARGSGTFLIVPGAWQPDHGPDGAP